MSTDLTPAVPAAGSHPYPDPSVLPEGFYGLDLRVKYERMTATDKAAFDAWEIGARERVFGHPGRHVAAFRTAPGRAVTVPDAPVPLPLPLPAGDAAPLRVHRPSWFAKHGRNGNGRHVPKRDEAPERTESVWQPPEGRNGTLAPPVASGQDDDTLLPGAIEPVPAIGALDIESEQHMTEFLGAHDDFPAKPDEWTDAAKQMTSALERPVNTGEQE